MSVHKIRIGGIVECIEGWGLNNPCEESYLLRETGEYAGHCQSETCFHNSHDPYGPIMRMTLKSSGRPDAPDKIIYLGETGDYSWYTGPAQYKLLRIEYRKHYNDIARVIAIKYVPISIEETYFSFPKRTVKETSLNQINKVYTERNAVVGMALTMAKKLGYHVGIKVEDPDWPIIFINLPTGQVSWHIAKEDLIGYFPDSIEEYAEKYDGHTTVEKYGRLVGYAQGEYPKERPRYADLPPDPDSYSSGLHTLPACFPMG